VGGREHSAARRERFLDDAVTDAVRPEIAASWRRSKLSGVSPDRVPVVPMDDLSERSYRLLHVARPVLDRLAEELAGTVTSMIVTDPQARILARRVGERGLNRSLDQVMAVPGALYGEDVVGTNALGTVIELRRPVMVAGFEHFHEMLQLLTCVGAPLVHPITGRLEGVLDLTCRYEDTNELMLPVVLDAAREITRGLQELASRSERLLLDRFVVATRRTGRAVVTLNRDVIIANVVAARLLEPADHALLWAAAEASIDSGRRSDEVVLSGGSVAAARVQSITDGRELVGAVVEFDLPRDARRPDRVASRREADLPGLVGSSPPWRQLCRAVREHASGAAGIAVLGPAGAGKLAVAHSFDRVAGRRAEATVVDAGTVLVEGPAAWLSRLRSDIARPGTVILRHADLLPADLANAAGCLLESAHAECRVLATAGARWPREMPRLLVDRFPISVHVPALAQRAADVAELATALAERYGSSQLRWSNEVLSALVRCPWPGNVRELEALVRATVSKRPKGHVGLEDLPGEYRCASGPGSLTALEHLERDAIVRALADAAGSKVDAAAALGISRSTLYRKLKAYAIDI
jgi:transcriptional regulator of acetoin/glycerol metabolism